MLDAYDTGKKEKSQYQPSKAVQERTLKDKKAYESGYDIQKRAYPEFNDLNVLQVQDRDQKIFNLYEDPEPTDPDLKWRSRSVRAGARNNVISIAAHLISAMMYPNFGAQNEHDDEDQDAAQVMRDMVLWNIENSDYEMSMLFGVVAACVNPCMYMGVEYAEAMQQVRKDFEGNDISPKDVIDAVISGLHVEPIPLEEMLISNIYQYDHQKQPCRIRKRIISYEEAEARHGGHDNFKFVSPGVQAIFNESEATFYDVDETAKNESMVEEVTFMYRRQDTEISYVNGIYMGNKDVNKNAMKHRRLMLQRDGDLVSVPLYPEAKSIYEPIDEKRFYYGKSCVDKLLPDHKRLQKMARLAEDATVLSVLKPVLVSGRAKINQTVVFPAGVTSVPQDSKMDFVDIGANIASLYENMVEAEKEMSKSSQDELRQGTSASQDRTAYELSRIEQNAIIKEFAIFGRMIARMVEDAGGLMADCITHHQTTLEFEEVTGGMGRLMDKKFLLKNQNKEGRKITKELLFTDEYMGQELSPEQMEGESWKIYDEQEDRGGNVEIFKINPYLFARRRYTTNCDVDSMMPKSMAFEEERKIRAQQLLSVSPFANREAIDRDFLFDPLTDGQADKYMMKASDLGIVPGMPMPNDPNNPNAPVSTAPVTTGLPEPTGVI